MPAHPFGKLPSQSFVQTTGPLQPSVAVAAPFSDNHDRKLVVLSSMQVTIGLVAEPVINGYTVSIVVYVDVQLALLPASSVTTNTYTEVDVPPQLLV